jgi:outer membrane protein assembly factor BamB
MPALPRLARASLLASLHVSLAMPAAAVHAAPAQPDATARIDVTTYHYDALRTGWNPSETALTPATVASAKFGLLHTFAVDGNVLAQPLLVSGFRMPDGMKHDVLIVVTEHNSVYAFDTLTYAQLWTVNLGHAQSAIDLGCNFLFPEYGVSATPVIVREGPGEAAVYLVAATEPTSDEYHHVIHKLDLATGRDLAKPVDIAAQATMSDGSTVRFIARTQWIRAGMAWGNGSLYVAVSSQCDDHANRISGWLLRYGADLSQQAAFSTVTTPAKYELASIWMTGFAPAIDDDGSLFVVTGNGAWDQGGNDWGESVLRLPKSLSQVTDWFTPASVNRLNHYDEDFGSGGVMLLPVQPGQLAPPLAVAMGKSAQLYLLDRTDLGHKRTHDAGALQKVDLRGKGEGLWGGPAYYLGPQGGVVFYQVELDVLRAFAVSTGNPPALEATVKGATPAGVGGSLPIVSSNGSEAGTAVVWLVNRSSPLRLEAYDAEKLGTPIFTGAIGAWGSGRPFLTPIEANGRVYVGTTGQVAVFGLVP